MNLILDFLAKYSNLLLAVITGVYAFLTWKMVSEMRKSRENQVDSHLIASPVYLGQIYVQVQLINSGPGPALNVELSISLDPLLDTKKSTWLQPALVVGETNYFRIPTKDFVPLRELAEKYKNLVIELNWNNIFGQKNSKVEKFNLHHLVEGWYYGGHLLPPDDLPTQIDSIIKVLEKMQSNIEKINRN